MSNGNHYSPECAPNGSGQCDGYDYEAGNETCCCICHWAWELPSTVAEVKVWHDEINGVVPEKPFDQRKYF